MEAVSTSQRARSIVQYLARNLNQEYGFGSMSPAVYDTAWLAMVSKEKEGTRQWLFPDSFTFLLQSQSSDGGWTTQSSDVDAILNTMAALLAISNHERFPEITGCDAVTDLASRLSRGVEFLRQRLQTWDANSTVHVGFEILIPCLLNLLKAVGLEFQFPCYMELMAINEQKLAKFRPEILYSNHQTTLIHSLEAFIGKIDFDRVTHHLNNGSMMASPSSTAAYLMHRSTWDDEAEAYLRSVVSSGEGNGLGSVPSAFPSTIFEITWILSTLLESAFSTELLGKEDLLRISEFLQLQLQLHGGIVGFVPGLLADADDTAKSILTLNLLGHTTDVKQMISAFETPTHFRTYKDERNASFSANCNVLNALLHTQDPSAYFPQIKKTADFLCDAWYSGELRDKWNLSTEYPNMLLAQAFTSLLRLWDNESLSHLPDDLISRRCPIVLFQILVRTLQGQSNQGSWGTDETSTEITAYAVLTLKSLSTLPWAKLLGSEVASAIQRGSDFLETHQDTWDKPAYIWVEKVTYGSRLLAETYCLSALQATVDYTWGDRVAGLNVVDIRAVTKFSQFFSRLPLFSGEPGWRLRASLIEGYLFAPGLRHIRLNVFPRKDMQEDKYLEYIPLTWTMCNNKEGFALSTGVLWDMMIVSMLNYQADEYMESVVGESFGQNLQSIKSTIRHLCHGSEMMPMEHHLAKHLLSIPNKYGSTENIPTSDYQTASECSDPADLLDDVESTLSNFTSYILKHPRVSSISSSNLHLEQELTIFLLAHVTHCEDNIRFATQSPPPDKKSAVTEVFTTPQSTYFNWVRTTSADHTSCPYSFQFFSCLIAPAGRADCFRGVRQKYLAQDLCRHLASMCRQYNDYGSIARDRAEGNLNSVNFLEFHEPPGLTTKSSEATANRREESAIKDDLFWVAEYERECLELSARKLEKELGGGPTWKALRTFISVTDLYGQIYVARDIASRMK